MTTSVSTTFPEAPAVYVIVWMFVALVIVPFVIDQAYVVAPAGPAAVLPVTFAQSVAGVGVIAGVAGAALIGTSRLFDAGQWLAFVTVRLSVTLPEAPAVYVIVWRSVALVIVPFVIDQAYVVAPAGPSAVFVVEPAQTCAGVGVIVGVAGTGLIGTLRLFVAEQPPGFVIVSVRPTLPEDPAVYVMVWMFVALVIVPFVIDQAYVV
ncbi:MAG TPA: hypothetical protein VLJ18_03935, partial [Thermoanaerobaculia bacterium]|nr:hypothetical protein [Thermoanaerobaculia bacterium]